MMGWIFLCPAGAPWPRWRCERRHDYSLSAGDLGSRLRRQKSVRQAALMHCESPFFAGIASVFVAFIGRRERIAARRCRKKIFCGQVKKSAPGGER
jgi:hypothetical protein